MVNIISPTPNSPDLELSTHGLPLLQEGFVCMGTVETDLKLPLPPKVVKGRLVTNQTEVDSSEPEKTLHLRDLYRAYQLHQAGFEVAVAEHEKFNKLSEQRLSEDVIIDGNKPSASKFALMARPRQS